LPLHDLLPYPSAQPLLTFLGPQKDCLAPDPTLGSFLLFYFPHGLLALNRLFRPNSLSIPARPLLPPYVQELQPTFVAPICPSVFYAPPRPPAKSLVFFLIFFLSVFFLLEIFFFSFQHFALGSRLAEFDLSPDFFFSH